MGIVVSEKVYAKWMFIMNNPFRFVIVSMEYNPPRFPDWNVPRQVAGVLPSEVLAFPWGPHTFLFLGKSLHPCKPEQSVHRTTHDAF